MFYLQSREVDRTKRSQIKEANFYFFIEAAIALFVSFLINLFVQSVFAKGFYGKTNLDIVSTAFTWVVLDIVSTAFTWVVLSWVYTVRFSAEFAGSRDNLSV